MAKNNSGDISVREAGRRGGLATSKSHGARFYQEIGRKGGLARGAKSKKKSEKSKNQ